MKIKIITLLAGAVIVAVGFLVTQIQAGVVDNSSAWAWSENIGWLSFNRTNCDIDDDGFSDGIAPGCPLAGTPIPDYGVHVDSATGDFSGYAWSENIGWIRLDPNGPYPEAPDYSVCLDFSGGGQTCDGVGNDLLSGWARVCSGAVDQIGCAETFSETTPGVLTGISGSHLVSDEDYLYIVGSDSEPGNRQWRIEKRSKKSGKLVSEFGGDGIVQSDLSASDDDAKAVAMDDTYVYIGGTQLIGGSSEWRVEKIDKVTGAPVLARNGRVADGGPPVGSARVLEVAVDDTFIYVLGTEDNIRYWRIEKWLKADFTPVTAFDGDGAKVLSFEGYPEALVVDDELYIGGYERCEPGPCSPSWRRWHTEKRSKTDGSLITAFDGDGIVVSILQQGDPQMQHLIVDGGDLFLMGRTESPIDQWHIEKRNKMTGAYDPVFGAGSGIVTSDPTLESDVAIGGAVDANYLYVGGQEDWGGDRKSRIEKRDRITGALVAEFGSGGSLTINLSGSTSVYSLVVDSGYVYFIGNDGSALWHIEKRDIVSGRLNWPDPTTYVDPAASVFASNPRGGDWDGWIKLRDTGAVPYGVSWDLGSKELSGWAWGSDVVGWVSFNSINCDADDDGFSDGVPAGCPAAGTPIPDYEVIVDILSPPSSAQLCLVTTCPITSKGANQFVSLSWTDSGNETSYEVYRDGDSTPIATLVAGIDYSDGDATIFYVDSGLTDNQSYTYQVTAFNSAGSADSNAVVLTVPTAIPGDFTLTGLRVAGDLQFSWTAAATTLAASTVTYTLERDDTSSFTTTIVPGCADISVLTCNDTSPTVAEPWYRVVATNFGGSTVSNSLRIVISLFPDKWREISPF